MVGQILTLIGVISAGKIAGKRLSDMSYVCAGAGSAGLGVCDQIVKGMIAEGMSEREARSKFVVLTAEGALGGIPNKSKPTKHIDERTAGWVNKSVQDGANLLEVIKQVKPNVLLGLTATPNIFTEDIIRTMTAQNATRPIIMPMSNPTSRCECTAEQAYKWSGKSLSADPMGLNSYSLFLIRWKSHCCDRISIRSSDY
jgi:malic enzyme